MSDIKLFRTINGTVEELEGTSVQLEKSLQTLIEQNLDTLLGIRFLVSEYSTGKTHGGRIDTLGIDENGCPIIIEYKRALNENVINQGLFYLDWLMDHKADFRWLVMDRVGKEQAENIEWAASRLLCIAGSFTNYDEHAIKQIPRNIELIRYRRYGDDYLLLELVNATTASIASPSSVPVISTGDYSDIVGQTSKDVRDLFEALKASLFALGDDVQMKVLKNYIAFTRIRTFAYVRVRLQLQQVIVDVNVDPDSIILEPDFTYVGQDKILRIRIKNAADLEKAQPLLLKSYEAS